MKAGNKHVPSLLKERKRRLELKRDEWIGKAVRRATAISIVKKLLFTIACIALLTVLTRLSIHVNKNVNVLRNVNKTRSFTIFYNVYIDPRDVTNALRIVKEQLDQVVHSSFYNELVNGGELNINVVSIGELNEHTFLGSFLEKTCKERNLTCHHLDHYEEGFEEVTLSRLYDYCQEHGQERVGYIHNKGSYQLVQKQMK